MSADHAAPTPAVPEHLPALPPIAPDGDAAQVKHDLRFSNVEQGGVVIARDLSGQGHLARGSRTNMSNMRFSVRAQPRTERDPELQALHESSAAPHVGPIESAAAASVAAASVAAAAAAPALDPVPPASPITPPVAPPVAPHGDGLVAAIKRLFS